MRAQASDTADDASVVMPQEAGLEITKVTYHGVDALGELRCLLKDVTLVVSPGQKVALVGDIAGSAAVLVKLCTRLYKPDGGSISVSQVRLLSLSLSPNPDPTYTQVLPRYYYPGPRRGSSQHMHTDEQVF